MNLRRLGSGVQVVVTAALGALVLRNVDRTVFQASFSRPPPWLYLATVGELVAGQAPVPNGLYS